MKGLMLEAQQPSTNRKQLRAHAPGETLSGPCQKLTLLITGLSTLMGEEGHATGEIAQNKYG
jgi:hypothetical protein